MITASDAILADLSLDSYLDTPASLPVGFTPAAALPVAATPGLAGYDPATGIFHGGSGAALATTGLLDGRQTLVIAFRGSDDGTDSIHDLRDINAAYADFAPLAAAIGSYAASGAVQQVVITGHSLGGAMAQLFMAAHPGEAAPGIAYRGETFGSPGALLAHADDARIENVVIADDPAVALGVHRAEIGAVLRADPALADAAATRITDFLPGLTKQEALDSLGTLTADYVNRGTLVLLPTVDGDLAPAGTAPDLLRLDEARHDAGLYVAATTAAAQGNMAYRDVPASPATAEDAYNRAVYAGVDGPAAEALAHDLAEALASRHDPESTIQAEIDALLAGARTQLDHAGTELTSLHDQAQAWAQSHHLL